MARPCRYCRASVLWKYKREADSKRPKNEEDAKSIAIATIGAGAVGAIEVAFGPQQWALAMMTKEGRAAISRKFALPV